MKGTSLHYTKEHDVVFDGAVSAAKYRSVMFNLQSLPSLVPKNFLFHSFACCPQLGLFSSPSIAQTLM